MKRISEGTKTLLDKRFQMKWDGKNIEYTLLCKIIHNKLKADLEEYWHKTL